MQPVLAQLGPVTIYSYGVFMTLAFAGGGYLTYRLARRSGLATGAYFDYFLYAAIAGLLGARLGHLILKPESLDSFWEIFTLSGGGLIFYSGLWLAGLLLIAAWRRGRQPIWRWLDVVTIGTAAGLVIGKIGSFLNGDSFGRPSNLPWAVQFDDPLAPAAALASPLHPTQLYAALGYAAVAGSLWLAYRAQTQGAIGGRSRGGSRWRQLIHRLRRQVRQSSDGTVFLAGLFGVAAVQLLVEFWRAPVDTLYFGQAIKVVPVTSLLLMAVAAVGLWQRHAADRRAS